MSSSPDRPRIVALVSGLGWHVEDLQRAARCLNIAFEAVPFQTLTGRLGARPARISAARIDLTRADGVLVRMMPPGGLEPIVFRMDLLLRLEAAGVPVWNPPRTVEAAVDKFLATAKLAAAGLPVPETWAGESAQDALEAFADLGGDVVVKPLFGSEGRGMVRVTAPEIAWRVFTALERIGSVIYLQPYLPNPGADLRAFVLNGRVLGAMRRHARPGEWRANVAVGGRPEACRLEPEAERLALNAARAVGARLAGVDLLPGPDGALTVLEVNAVPGWKALAAATGIDVALEILDALREARP